MNNDFYSMPPDVMKAADMAINQVDWTKVYKVMDFLDWTWWNLKDVPTQYDLIKRAKELCASCYFECKGDEYHTGTGGIYVDYIEHECWFQVSFVIDRGEGSMDAVRVAQRPPKPLVEVRILAPSPFKEKSNECYD